MERSSSTTRMCTGCLLNPLAAALRLDDLIHDGKAQASSALEVRLERLKDLGTLLWVEADAGVAKCDVQPKRALFNSDGERPAFGHSPQRVVAQIPEHLLYFIGIHTCPQLVTIKRAHNLILGADFRLFLDQRQSFIQKSTDVGVLKFVGLLA